MKNFKSITTAYLAHKEMAVKATSLNNYRQITTFARVTFSIREYSKGSFSRLRPKTGDEHRTCILRLLETT